MTTEQILEKLETRDALVSSTSLGTIKSAFPDHKMLVVKKSKTGAKRATILLEKDGKVLSVICSEQITPLVRSGEIKTEHIAGFPLIYNEELNKLFVGMPAEGWKEVREIEVTDFSMEDVV